MYIEISSEATLRELDLFLRDIWLECCGHMSLFRINGRIYVSEQADEDWGEDTMDETISSIAQVGLKFDHEYDFGSTTSLKIRVISSRIGDSAHEEELELLARNIAPDIRCHYCGGRAELVASHQCWSEDAWVCGSCAAKHDDGDGDGWRVPIANSPRTGVCAYSD